MLMTVLLKLLNLVGSKALAKRYRFARYGKRVPGWEGATHIWSLWDQVEVKAFHPEMEGRVNSVGDQTRWLRGHTGSGFGNYHG